ncbi:hypothetical protein J422_03903 [Methanocaldococcus villosus KIN24-T80]|uniref:Uncharacterized protein n=1 Tax=Methanocaldococcus villosus KIN24-T80 TaxID=1069083 RepID=N6UUY3_9EURY|nr:hypothetical protein [Methanocaldococcus villosus]ENN96169.1 hypothetical protein J422_03903 [Methanocaldococcus villosus KIN24-T80]
MDYSFIKPIFREKIIDIDKGSLKTKRKFAFLLEKGDVLLEKREFYANDEVEVVDNYQITDSNRPKEKIKLYIIEDIIKE